MARRLTFGKGSGSRLRVLAWKQVAAGIAGAAVTLAACSSASPPAATTDGFSPGLGAQVTTAPTPSLSPPLTTAELATAYSACADSADAAEDAIMNTQFSTLSGATQVAGELAAADGTFMMCLRAIAWTPLVETDVHALLVAESAIQVTELAMSKAPTVARYDSLFATWKSQNLAAGSSANQLRGDLGLPPPLVTVASAPPK